MPDQTETATAAQPTTDAVERSIHVDAPLERVWHVVTAAEHVGAWFSDDGAEVDLRPGGAMVLVWKEYGRFLMRIDVVEPPHRLVVRWVEEPDVEPEPGIQTTIEMTLRADSGGTLLTVRETGFDTLAVPFEKAAEHRAGNVEGWEHELREVRDYVAGLAADEDR